MFAKLETNETVQKQAYMGSTGIAFRDADKSQLAVAVTPASDRIAFALCPS